MFAAGFVPRPQRLDFDQTNDGHQSVSGDDLQERSSYAPTPPDRERRYKNNNHQEHHHHHVVSKVPEFEPWNLGQVNTHF